MTTEEPPGLRPGGSFPTGFPVLGKAKPGIRRFRKTMNGGTVVRRYLPSFSPVYVCMVEQQIPRGLLFSRPHNSWLPA